MEGMPNCGIQYLYMYINTDKEKRIEIFEDTMRLCRENAKLADAIKNFQSQHKILCRK